MSIFELYNLPKPRGYSEKGKFIYSCPYCGKERKLYVSPHRRKGRCFGCNENFLIDKNGKFRLAA